jgi:aspartyl-tRNA(Asn)/glutamyl-tRNA(Gln) amidotransferase subunit A
VSQYAYSTIRSLSEKLSKGEISPLDLTKAFLDRLERIGPRYNAVVTVMRERAVEEAQKAEDNVLEGKKSLLQGIPYGAKDLLAAKGGPTTWGAAPFKNQVFNYDATLIKKLNEAGAVLSAKLAMIELAGGMGYRQPNASLTGPPKNPWNPEFWTGGSSSGSGAAVAAGLVPFAIGSETWGSILSPANNCGVTGLRPTYGRVSRFGAMALSYTLDKVGPLCLTADDCGIVLEAIAGADKNDQSTLEKDYKYEALKEKGFKLAVFKDVTKDAHKEVTANFERSIKELEKVATVEEVVLPDLPYEEVTRTILNAEAASAFDQFTELGLAEDLTAPEDRYGAYARSIVLAKDYLKALKLRGVMAKAADKVMIPYDAVIAPTRKSPATPIDEEFRRLSPGTSKDVMGALGNGAGLPAITVPNGFTEKGLPTGIQFMGKAFDENIILSIAKKYQDLTSWHKKHPNIPV